MVALRVDLQQQHVQHAGLEMAEMNLMTEQGNSMRYREITETQARQVLKVLVEECGHKVHDPRDADAFVRSIVAPKPDKDYVCHEYRFCGELGFGGKFRNNGNINNTPYVDCYQEHETPARLQMIDAANKRIAEIFAND